MCGIDYRRARAEAAGRFALADIKRRQCLGSRVDRETSGRNGDMSRGEIDKPCRWTRCMCALRERQESGMTHGPWARPV